MLTKAVIVFLLLMVLVAWIGKALTGRAQARRATPVCPRCGRLPTGRGTCDCGRRG